jgi:alkylation response protein AidB-like acyl-CoA dehydrogenase
MNLEPTESEAELRGEVRAWLREHLPWEYGKGLPPRFDDLTGEVAFGREWQAKLAEGRWVGVAWPEEYGGRGAGAVEHFIVTEELARARAPELVGRIGVNLVGPTLLAHGTPEQKARWRQKVWTSYAQFADWGVCLARTDTDVPKQRGISYLVIDMSAPGVEVRPLRQITDESEFNEVFFSDVFVPTELLIGAENEGWRIASSTLSHERGMNPRQLVIHIQLVEELLRLALERGAFDDHRLRGQLAQAAVEVRLFQLHNWRTLSRLARGEEPGPEGSALKLYWSEMSKRLHDTVMTVLGPAAPLWRGAHDNPGDGSWQRSWLYYQASSIFAGTNEIQRNIIGERVLALPREPKS